MTSVTIEAKRWLLLLLAACAPGAVAADALPGGYVEAAYLRGSSRPADGGPIEEGGVAAFRLPLGRQWFVTGSARRLDPYTDAFDFGHAEEARQSIGLGVRKGTGRDEMYARLTYTDIEDWRYFNQTGGGGTTLSVGGRALWGRYLEGAIEGGIGVINGDQGEDNLLFPFRIDAALRLLPALSAYAAYESGLLERGAVQVGLRLNFAHARPRTRPPGLRSVDPGARVTLEVGRDVVAARALQAQVRPAFGAPETFVVPAGETLALVETARNDFGNWWRVSWNGQQGWIREGWLLPR